VDIIRVPALRLKLQEHGRPSIDRREVHEQAAVLPHAVVVHELAAVALVHVDVVDAVARQEPEDLVAQPVFRSPPLAEGVQQRILFRDRRLHDAIELVVQIVIGAGQVHRQRPHAGPVEQIAADEVEAAVGRLVAKPVEPCGASAQRRGEGMAEVVVHEVLDLGRGELRLHVHRDAVFGGVVYDVHLIVGVGAPARHAVQRPADEQSVLGNRHGCGVSS